MASPVISKVALLGGSGKLGQPLLFGLLNNHFDVTAIARSSSTYQYPDSVTVKRVSDSYNRKEVADALAGQDAVIIALAFFGNADHHRTIIDAAADAGVKHLIPNFWSTNAEISISRKNSQRQIALENDIEYLRGKEAQISWTAIVPGIFFDLAFPYGLLGFNLREKSVEIWDNGDATFSASTNDDLANTTIAVLRQPQRVKNQYVYTQSFSTSQNQLLALVESISGQKWPVRKVTSEEKVKQAKEVFASGAQGMQYMMAEGTMAASALFGGEDYQSDFERAGKSSNSLLDLKTRNIEESVRKYVS